MISQTANEYLAEYNSRRGKEYSRFHGYVRKKSSFNFGIFIFPVFKINQNSTKKYTFLQTYDGIWAAALAIQYVAKRKEHFVHKFEYRVKDWENIFLDALRNTSFEGVTVHQSIKYFLK